MAKVLKEPSGPPPYHAWTTSNPRRCLRAPRAVCYRGTSLIGNNPPGVPYSRDIPRPLWYSQGGGRFLMSESPLYYPESSYRVLLSGFCGAPIRATREAVGARWKEGGQERTRGGLAPLLRFQVSVPASNKRSCQQNGGHSTGEAPPSFGAQEDCWQGRTLLLEKTRKRRTGSPAVLNLSTHPPSSWNSTTSAATLSRSTAAHVDRICRSTPPMSSEWCKNATLTCDPASGCCKGLQAPRRSSSPEPHPPSISPELARASITATTSS